MWERHPENAFRFHLSDLYLYTYRRSNSVHTRVCVSCTAHAVWSTIHALRSSEGGGEALIKSWSCPLLWPFMKTRTQGLGRTSLLFHPQTPKSHSVLAANVMYAATTAIIIISSQAKPTGTVFIRFLLPTVLSDCQPVCLTSSKVRSVNRRSHLVLFTLTSLSFDAA